MRTTCPYCGVGCGVIARREPDGSVAVRGDPDHPANFGRLCSKGSALGETLGADGRLTHPEVDGKRVSWDEALDTVADTFRRTIAEHGPDSVAFYLSGQMLTEDYYVANKLMKGFIGSANVDTNSRLCMASSVAGHRRAFGSDTVPGTYEDLEIADLVVLVGSNLAWCHPVLHQRLAAAKAARPSMRVVLVDPRRTMTADLADLHLPIRADGDGPLFMGLLSHLATSGAVDADYVDTCTAGYGEALAAAGAMTVEAVAGLTGLAASDIAEFYALFAATDRVVTVYSQGVNQSACGTDKVGAIINCHLATGRIGRPGAGPFSVTGQPNAMGGREVGGLATMLAAHMDIENPAHRDTVRRFWSSPAMPTAAGLKAVDLFQAIADGRVKAVWIVATNPVVSLPDAGAVAAALAACPFVVVSDVVDRTDTLAFADVKLPAAAWGEKDGTVTNSERRISRQRRFLPPPGEARSDFAVIADVAARMGFGGAFDYAGPADVFAEHAALSGFENGGTRSFDISAHASIDAAAYDALDPFQWPQPAGSARGETRFFANGGFFTPDGRARFVAIDAPTPALTTPDRPFVLNSGRVRDHWHTLTRTGRSARLSQHIAEPFAELHPADADRLQIRDADLVEVETDIGAVVVRALITPRQRPGSVFVPMHWSAQFASNAGVGRLYPPVTDPISGQPALKHAGASVRRVAASVYGFAVSRDPTHPAADYFARAACPQGWRTELACLAPIDDPAAFARALFALDPAADVLAYADRQAGSHRVAAFAGDKLVGALFLSDSPVEVSRTWAVSQLAADHGDLRARYRVIAGRAAADRPDPGALVCSCFGVGANQVAAAAMSGARTVAEVGRVLQAGTNCGSCRAEIASILSATGLAAAE